MRLADFETDIPRVRKEKKTDEQLYAIEDILEKRNGANGEEVLVKWENWDGGPEWIKLSRNVTLKKYLDINKANPYSCTLTHKIIQAVAPIHLNTHVQGIRQAIYDSLGACMATPDGQIGCVTKTSISLPFPKETFDSVFRSCRLSEIPPEQNANVKCMVTHTFLTETLGPAWDVRESANSSTEMRVNASRPLLLEWGYISRSRWNHSKCPR